MADKAGPTEAAKAWNGTRVADTRAPEWRSRMPDTSRAVICQQCGRRWLNADWLELHIEADHNAKPARGPRTDESAQALELVTRTITDRIDSGEWKPRHLVSQAKLGTELGVSPHFVRVIVRQLADAGWLAFEGEGYNRRVIVTPTRSSS